MERAIYEKLWENTIYPKIEEMLSDNDIIFVGGQIKEKIWLTYEKYKNSVHTYMHNPNGRIDRHKVASAMLYSIIVNKPFDLKILSASERVNSTAILANEILGFNVALAIVWSFIISEANEKSDRNRIEIFENRFIFPQCQHDSYEANIYKMLYYARLNKNYDIFAFANILFLIEAYTEFVRKTELERRVF